MKKVILFLFLFLALGIMLNHFVVLADDSGNDSDKNTSENSSSGNDSGSEDSNTDDESDDDNNKSGKEDSSRSLERRAVVTKTVTRGEDECSITVEKDVKIQNGTKEVVETRQRICDDGTRTEVEVEIEN